MKCVILKHIKTAKKAQTVIFQQLNEQEKNTQVVVEPSNKELWRLDQQITSCYHQDPRGSKQAVAAIHDNHRTQNSKHARK